MDLLEEEFDWVGQLKNMKETIAIFNAMGMRWEEIHSNRLTGEIQKQLLHKSDFNETAMELLNGKNDLDQELLDYAKQTYTLEMYGLDSTVFEDK